MVSRRDRTQGGMHVAIARARVLLDRLGSFAFLCGTPIDPRFWRLYR